MTDSDAHDHSSDSTNNDNKLEFSDDDTRVEISDYNKDDEWVPVSKDIKITPRQQPAQSFTICSSTQEEDPGLSVKQKHKPDKTPARKERTSIIRARKASSKKGPKKKGIKTPVKKKRDGDPNWKSVGQNLDNPNNREPFIEVSGPARRVLSCGSTCLSYFMLFFTKLMLEVIVNETNRYHDQCTVDNTPAEPWTPLTLEELMAFLGVTMAMGIVRLPEVSDYWAKSGILHLPWFCSIFKRKRFQQISRNLHLANNQSQAKRGEPGYNKLFKLGVLPTTLDEKFGMMYTPTRDLSIDEQMIGTKARVIFIQYMPKKPKKFGIKLWALCEAKTGYCLQFQIYSGKSDTGQEHGLGYRVVFDLLRNYFYKGYRVFFDNFYTGLKLVTDLAAKSFYSCGTVRVDRGDFPESFKTKLKTPGEALYLKNNNVFAVHWRDKRDVFVMSSFDGSFSEVVERKGGQEPIEKPSMIINYNKNMNGVDKCDQYLNYYSIGRKSIKWWKKVFFDYLISVINAMVLFFHQNPDFEEKQRSHKAFRIQLIYEFCATSFG